MNSEHPIEKSTILFNPPHIPDASGLRDYQKNCLDAIEKAGDGSHLIVMATGLGKTYCFSHIPRRGRVLLLSHRDELVRQPQKYYDCSFGVEKAKEHSHGEEIVSASVQSLVRRLHKFDPYEFDMIITDEAHHAVAPSYRKIYDYFKPRVHLGFTATPNRDDKADLKKVYDDIIFNLDIKWGIKNNFLTDIDCLRVDVGYDLRNVKKVMGDFCQSELSEVVKNPYCVNAVAEAYQKYHKGQTLIFAANVEHAGLISSKIPGSVVVTADTKNRAEIIKDFTDRKIPCLINVMVFSEGTDMPLIETVIMARPTANQSLYAQMIGRGLRPYVGKKELTLVDCVGVSRLPLCTAPNLFGLNTEIIPETKRNRLRGRLTQMESVIEQVLDCPESWVKGAERVSLFQEMNNVNLRGLNFTTTGNDTLHLFIGDEQMIIVPPTNALGNTSACMIKKKDGKTKVLGRMKEQDLQSTIDAIQQYLEKYKPQTKTIWSADIANKTWGKQLASLKQMDYIKLLFHQSGIKPTGVDIGHLSKQEASSLITVLKEKVK